MEIQQSPLYAAYIRSLGWKVETLDGIYVFIRPFAFIGGLAKIQRSIKLPTTAKLKPLLAKYGIRTLVVEPDSRVKQADFSRWCKDTGTYVRINKDPFIPTKTIRVRLTDAEPAMFARFTEAKQRAVRRSIKAGVIVSTSEDIQALITLKNKSAGFLGFITTAGVSKLWQILPLQHKSILIARSGENEIIGAIFLLFWQKVAYYWIAGALPKGKKMFAPTLLVWEAMKIAKKQGMHWLDFVGVWDERTPNKNLEWKGFTKFKEGFGGETLYYPLPG